MSRQCFLTGKRDRLSRPSFLMRRHFWWRGFILLFALALTLTLCIPVNAKEKPKSIPQEWQIRGIEAALGDERSGVLQAAFSKLSDYEPQAIQSPTKQDTVQKLANILRDQQQDPGVRGNAAKALGNFGEAAKQYIPDIAAILRDQQQDPGVRGSAAEALGNFGEAAKQYIPDIAAILKDQQQDSGFRGSAAEALGNFGEAAKQYIPDILAFIKDQQQDSGG